MAKQKANVIPLKAARKTQAAGSEISADDLMTQIFQSEFGFIIASDLNKDVEKTGRLLKHGTKNAAKK
jgi:hypothetical protein